VDISLKEINIAFHKPKVNLAPIRILIPFHSSTLKFRATFDMFTTTKNTSANILEILNSNSTALVVTSLSSSFLRDPTMDLAAIRSRIPFSSGHVYKDLIARISALRKEDMMNDFWASVLHPLQKEWLVNSNHISLTRHSHLHSQLDSEESCSICMDDLSKVQCELPCGHIFDKSCIERWIQRQRTCPNCRRYISPYTTRVETQGCFFLFDIASYCFWSLVGLRLMIGR
jgi:hypothetical protein